MKKTLFVLLFALAGAVAFAEDSIVGRYFWNSLSENERYILCYGFFLGEDARGKLEVWLPKNQPVPEWYVSALASRKSLRDSEDGVIEIMISYFDYYFSLPENKDKDFTVAVYDLFYLRSPL
jgi:hypothetical protein